MSEIVLVIGYPASGKSTYTLQNYPKHMRINRDLLGGKIEGLVPIIEKHIKNGVTDFVLDNTHGNLKSRSIFINLAKRYGLKAKCVWIKSEAEDAAFFAARRMIKKYGRLLERDEIKSKKDTNTFDIGIIYMFRKNFVAPSKSEGFCDLREVELERDLGPEYTNKALFLDYDGTLRSTKSGAVYPKDPEDIIANAKVIDHIKSYESKGYKLCGVSNQSGIHKGDISHETAKACFDRTNELLGLNIDYMYCPHASGPLSCYCRKPGTGMLVSFIEKYKLDPTKCLMVGDMKTDESCANRAGVPFKYIKDFETLNEPLII